MLVRQLDLTGTVEPTLFKALRKADEKARAWRRRIYIGSILFLIFLLNLHPLWKESTTYDEATFYRYGRQLLFDHTTSKDKTVYFNSKMPVSALNALPEWILTSVTWKPFKVLVDAHLERYLYTLARLPTVFLSLLLALLVFSAAKSLFGQGAGLIALVLYAFSPNILAHSKLVTSDLYATCLIFAAVWSFRNYLNAPTRRNLLLSSITLGLAQLTKYTAIHLFPIFVILLLVVKGNTILDNLKNPRNMAAVILMFVKTSVFFLLVTVLIINIGFLFENVFVPLKRYPLKSISYAGSTLQPFLDNVPVPLPFAYLHGLDLVKYADQTGTTFGNLYLLGELQTKPKKTGWWYYFSVAFLLKSTLGFLALCFLSIVVSRHRRASLLSNEIYLIVPVVYLFLNFSVFVQTQIGLRHILPIYPFLFVFIGRVFSHPNKIFKRVTALLIGAHIISSLSYHPHYLSYFNELIGDRKNMYRYLADSNVDWGQNRGYLKAYVEKNKNSNIKLSPKEATTGRIIVGVNELVGVFNPERFRWLRENYKPIDHISYSYLVYDVPERR